MDELFKVKNLLSYLDFRIKYIETIDPMQQPINFRERTKYQKNAKLEELNTLFEKNLNARSGQYPTYEFTATETKIIKNTIEETFTIFGGTVSGLMPKSEDAPIKFEAGIFINYLDIIIY